MKPRPRLELLQSPFVYLDYRRGEKYGRLTVTGLDDRGGQTRWYACLCECGEARSVIERRLSSGEVTECVRCEVRREMGEPGEPTTCEYLGADAEPCREPARWRRRGGDGPEGFKTPRNFCLHHFRDIIGGGLPAGPPAEADPERER